MEHADGVIMKTENRKMNREIIMHTIEPYCPKNAKLLILGTMPSPKSRESGFYYGHPQNRFWKIMAQIYEEAMPKSIEEKKAFLTRNEIALWDVLSSCSIVGASDSSIKDIVYNNLFDITENHSIGAIVTTGKKAGFLYGKHWMNLPITHINLPSTSPANCRMTLEELIQSYRIILNYTRN